MSKYDRTERIVRERYAAGARAAEAKLCCPVKYDAEYLTAIPQEVIERDYGCGDPTKYLREGETVLDLAAHGKDLFYRRANRRPRGKVIGVDMTDEMLEVARRSVPVCRAAHWLYKRGISERPHSGFSA